MEALKRARRPVKRQFETILKELEALLKGDEVKKEDEEKSEATFKLLCDTFDSLQQHDTLIREQMMDDNVPVAEEDKEYDEVKELKLKFETIRIRKMKMMPEKPAAYPESVTGSSVNSEARMRNFKLPTIKMSKFSGELTDWLAWWAQFQKIDEDAHMHGSDKFWYLLQSLEPGTDAYETAMGYPQSNENYPKVITALKKRYANQDLLLQVYIRQLLNLVISNVNAKEKIPVKSLYLKLDSHIRALKTLELEKADPATWLFPLVESSLPEKILDNWQRSVICATDGSKLDPPRTRLDLLMEFLEKEVDIKQRIDITRTFAQDQSQEKKSDQRVVKTAQRRLDKKPGAPTMASFHNSEKRSCVFCGMTNHESRNCLKAKWMTYEDKMEKLREKRACFRCCGNHLGKNCPSNAKCSICNRQHYTILCKELQRKNDGGSGEPTTKRGKFASPQITTTTRRSPPPPQKTTSSANIGGSPKVALKTLMVKVVSGEREELVRAFIDEGCERSYLSTTAARKLKLKPVGRVSAVHLLWGGHQTTEVQHKMYEVGLRSPVGDFEMTARVREQEPICGNLVNNSSRYPQVKEELKQKRVRLADAECGDKEIGLLIGADVYPHLLTGDFIRLESGPVAIRTKLGWTLMGELNEENESMSAAVMSMSTTDSHLTKFWDLEVMGIKEPAEEKAIQRRAELVRENYMESISRDNSGRYLVKLPWKENLPHLPENRVVAFKRLQAATTKLLQSGLYEKYDAIFLEWEKEGFIERVSVEEEEVQLHYLPHRPVIKPDSLTTPVRPVFDASCRVGKSPSLNDCLMTGENYILLILEILLRFRKKAVAFTADIRKAFQMIGIAPSDRDVLRFLWWADKEKKKVLEYRHVRVVFGVTCSPFILAVVLYHHLTNLPDEDKEMGKKLLSTLYVDNCASSENTVEEYKEFRGKAVELLSRASMDLRMWLDNLENLEDETTRVVSVLGLMWDRKEDVLFVNTKSINTPEKITKRTILSSIQKIFDPIGFTSPCVLPMKILLQQTWQGKTKWDEKLPEEMERKFLKWSKEAAGLEQLKIPRLCTGGESGTKNWSFLVFTDASALAYSGIVFLRTKQENKISVQLICAKSRVAPVKKMTIPKLELMGCLLGVRAFETVKKALRLDDVPVRYHTDSTTALAWIQRNDQWGTFVANRVKEIREHTRSEQWVHVPGTDNPADLPSRGCYPRQLIESQWWEGPSWLYNEEENRPSTTEDFDEEEIMAERRKTVTTEIVTSFSVVDRVQNSHSFASLVRVIGWVRRFLFNKFVTKKETRRSGQLSKHELEKAEKILVREIQRKAFPKNETGNLAGLELFEDDWGILRVKTRLTYREDLGNFRFPVLLPSKDERVKRLIMDLHRLYCHAGVGFMVTMLRKKYWIIKSRHTVRGVLNKCEKCRRFSSKSVVPEPAPLPINRVKDAEVFEVVGVDLAGPLFLKNGSKVWMVIYTCAVYRAVHFDLVKNISTPTFIKSLESFCEKYRKPAIIYSDNGTNFRGADNLFRWIDWTVLGQVEKISEIHWIFNPVTSSWWGGWFERLIRTAKDLLRRTVGKSTLSWDELKAILKTVAEVMNNRPLTYVSESLEDLEPLTPALFLHPYGKAELPERELSEAEKLRFRIKYVTTLRRELKDRFVKEYLAMLVNRHPKKATRELRVGELVFVGYDNVKRLEWPLGRVLENIPGRDRECRLARVRTEKGEIVRSVQRLYPLEADSDVEPTRIVREKGGVTRSGRTVRCPTRFE